MTKKLLLGLASLLLLPSQAHAAYTPSVTATNSPVPRILADRFTDHYNVRDWGAMCDGTILTDVTTTMGSPVISSVSYNFTTADVGKVACLTSQTTDNALLSACTTVASVTNTTGVQSATPVATGTGYIVGDTITLTGGAVLTVTGVTGSAVATVSVATPGAYSPIPANPIGQASTSGSGSGATFNAVFNSATLAASALGSKASPNYASLKMYMTDDTAAINAAIAAISPNCTSNCVKDSGVGNVGGYLDFPAGVCAASRITLDRQVILHGQGRQNTILLQVGGTNNNFVSSENFGVLTGTGKNYGPAGTFNGNVSSPLVPSWFGLVDIQVDGNRGYQDFGDCVDFYGNAQVWERTMVQDCYNEGMWTEASGAFAYDPTDWRAQEEGFLDDLIVRNTGKDGWMMRGPHDSQVTSYIAYGWGYSGSGYGFINQNTGGSGGGAHFGTIHPYTSNGTTPTDIYLGSGNTDVQLLYSDFGTTTIASTSNRIASVFLLSCGSSASATPCLDIQQGSNDIGQILGTWFYGTLPTGLTMVNIGSSAQSNWIGQFYASSLASSTASNTLLSVNSSFNTVTANLNNDIGTGDICAHVGGSYNKITLTGFSCATFLDYAAGTHNIFSLSYYVTGGEVPVNGAFSSTDVVTKTDTTGADFLNVEQGSLSHPSLLFGGSTTGMFGSGTDLDLVLNGALAGKFTSTGLQVTGGTALLGTVGSVAGDLKLTSATSGATNITPSPSSSNWTLQLPPNGGTSGYQLQTDGTGITSWVAPSSGTVNSGTTGKLAYYAANGTAVSGNSNTAISGGTLTLGTANTTGGSAILEGSTSGAVTIQPAATTGTWSLTLPTSAGVNGYVLQTNGSGVTSWSLNPSDAEGVTYLSGSWYTNQPRNEVSATYPTQGILVAMPILIASTNTFDRIGIEISAAGSGATAFFCVYDATGTNGGPGALISGGSTASAAISASGDFPQTLASPVSIGPGIYWLAEEFAWTTTAPGTYDASSTAPEAKFMPQGNLNQALGGGTLANVAYYLTNPYANGCPSTYGTPTGKVTSTSLAVIALHAQ